MESLDSKVIPLAEAQQGEAAGTAPPYDPFLVSTDSIDYLVRRRDPEALQNWLERHEPIDTGYDWKTQAACIGQDPELFFLPDGVRGPSKSRHENAAKQICARCKVVKECLRTAIKWEDEFAVMGGMTPEERGKGRQARRRAAS